MKFLFFAAALLMSSVSFAGQRVFDCSATQLSHDLEMPEDMNIKNNPRVLFLDSKDRWSLSVGDITLDSLDDKAPALWKEESSQDEFVRYDFWVDASYEYEVLISVEDHSAEIYWWGLGERIHIGNFACEVTTK